MQTVKNALEELEVLESFVQAGGILSYGPSVLFKKLAHRYPLHFIQFMSGYRPVPGAGARDTVHRHLPIAHAEVRQLSATLEHHLTQPPRSGKEKALFRAAVEQLEHRLWLRRFREPHFTHFLDIDQYTDDEGGLGIQCLFYHLDGATLHTRLTDSDGAPLGAKSYPAGKGSVKDILSAFLRAYFSEPGSHSGDNHYLWSPTFSQKEFAAFSHAGLEVKRQKRATAERLTQDNELIQYCADHHLLPRLEGSTETAWLARCPSGGNHTIMISTTSNEWGCGYCRKKGGLEELKQWVEAQKRSR